MAAASPPRPALALVGLLAGLALASIAARLARWPVVAVLLGAVLLGGFGAMVIGAKGSDDAVGTVAQARINLASPDRSAALRAALGVTADHPLTGAGPGQADLQRKGPDGATRVFSYAHNEYVQTAAEFGLVGVILLALLLAAFARLLWSARTTSPVPAAWSGAVAATAAFAVHSGFDFVWHLPAVVLTVVLLTGAVLPASTDADAPPIAHLSRRELDENQATN
jgi:O-antigen ligase